MSKIKLTGDTSGYVEISAPNVATNNTLELGGGTKILTNLDNVFTGVTTYSGNIDLNANLDLADNNKILIGTGDDLQIYHNGTNSYVLNNTTGDLRIEQAVDDRDIILQADNGSGGQANYLFCDGSSGRVVLSHYGSGKIETSSTGATVTGTLVSGSVTSELDLTAISSSISDTAVDVFVYDTRKDSDGGAWRKRTQHTSWYNETLNTSTRGSRREFPAVAVIVTTATNVTIYDGDDPDLPMWMNFQSGSYYFIGPGNRVKNSAHMLNGILCVTKSGSISWMSYISFVDDKARQYSDNDGEKRDYLVPISYRNSSNANAVVNSIQAYTIVNDATNDVAMTVLPNAPIDDATGLPIPTIAVATDGGVSVIKDNGSVYDLTTSDVYDVYGKVEFGDNNRLYYTGTNTQVLYSHAIPSADQNYTAYNTQNTNRVMFPTMDHGGFTSGHPVKLLGTNGSGNPLLIVKNKASGSNETSYAPSGYGIRPGLTFIDEGETNPTSTVAYATTSYNTGWMHGDIKGAFLSDTDTTNVTGSELVTNGTFDSNVNGWTAVNATITYSSGTAVVNRTGGTGPSAYQAITTVVGEKYVVTGTVDSNGTGGRGDIRIYSDLGSTMLVNAAGTDNQTVTVSATFTATTTTSYVYFTIDNTGTATFDNVSIRIAEEDRSANNKGLQVFGTVTKSAVATGADLVAYSGWSSSNYLIQPYNSDLNFGTGDFSTSFWVYTTDANLTGFVFDRGGPNNTDPRIAVYIENDLIVLYTYGSAGRSISHSFDEYENRWVHVVMTRHSSGVMQIFINGTIVSTTTTSVQNVTSSTNPDLIIGHRFSIDGVNALDASIALLRFSASIPSAEQIKKMYEDEKVLFQENAKATLYGSSDAVTALGYDEDTELLHVGTSSGRSDFQGLRRINNTTTAVTTAISASDDLIAEQ